jgi:hypothetical protein
MLLKVAIAAGIVVLGSLVLCLSWVRSSETTTRSKDDSSPTKIACTLDPAARDARRSRFARLRQVAKEITGLDNGYRLRFELDETVFRESTSLIFDESRCCSFLEFRLAVLPEQGTLVFEITGPAGTKEFLANAGFESGAQTKANTPSGAGKAGSCCESCGNASCQPGTR